MRFIFVGFQNVLKKMSFLSFHLTICWKCLGRKMSFIKKKKSQNLNLSFLMQIKTVTFKIPFLYLYISDDINMF